MRSITSRLPPHKHTKQMTRSVVAGFCAIAIVIPTQSVPVAPHPFVLEISAVQDRVRWGSQVELKLTLTNTSDAEIRFVDTDRWCDYPLDVRDEQGQLVPETVAKRNTNCTGQNEAGRRILVTLKPHESYSDAFFVNDAYDVSRPGEYFIHAMREIPKELGRGTVTSSLATATVDQTEDDVRPVEPLQPPDIEAAPMPAPKFPQNPRPAPPQR